MHSPLENNVKYDHMPTEKKVTHNIVKQHNRKLHSKFLLYQEVTGPLGVAIPSLSEPVRLRPIDGYLCSHSPSGQVFLYGN